ncbi:uncharacterized protein MELLADRAFT_94189 [Melampsora larici-populina 98AG31]|uniref:Uncharacterized protein n=1 Tax=Melampsora larici-populina (strain 98AG31 / pathotype 3-4-7) TaxID=747676 RepID=F4S6T0_MELLP|nr:uncharacterized protein MELLADRAFT_94189 [Melampsora larici-populina 98AG31]EGF99623.1 hypothetical protein MELLADRAFT_94189 [Melampsora larici-populina 98AG31]
MYQSYQLLSLEFSKPKPPRLQSYQTGASSSSTTNGMESPELSICLNCEDLDNRVKELCQHLGYMESQLDENCRNSMHMYDQLQTEVGELWDAKKKDRRTIHGPLRQLRVDFDLSTQSLEDFKDGLISIHHHLQEKIHGLKVELDSTSKNFRDMLQQRDELENTQTISLKSLVASTRAELLKLLQKGREELYESRSLRVSCENEVSNARAELREFQQEAREERIRASINHEQACEKIGEALNILSGAMNDFEERPYNRIEKRIFPELLKLLQKGREELFEVRSLRASCEHKVSNARAELREFQQEAREERIRAAINHEQACEKCDEALKILSGVMNDFEERAYNRIEKRLSQNADFDHMASRFEESADMFLNNGISVSPGTGRQIVLGSVAAARTELPKDKGYYRHALWIHRRIILRSMPGRYPQYLGTASIGII